MQELGRRVEVGSVLLPAGASEEEVALRGSWLRVSGFRIQGLGFKV